MAARALVRGDAPAYRLSAPIENALSAPAGGLSTGSPAPGENGDRDSAALPAGSYDTADSGSLGGGAPQAPDGASADSSAPPEHRSRRPRREHGFSPEVADEILSRYVGKTLGNIAKEVIATHSEAAEEAGGEAGGETERAAGWDHPVEAGAQESPAVEAPPTPEPVTPRKPTIRVPGGYFAASDLAQLMAQEGVFQGLVVAVRASTTTEIARSSRSHYERLLESAARTIRSLGEDKDFVAHVSDQDYILIFPQETGNAAQGRIQRISESLWDYQLRALGAHSVILNWGAAEAEAEDLGNVIENARRELEETIRGRGK
jgi:hypothetical protein